MENQVQRQGTKFTVLDYKIVPSFLNTILNYLLKLLLLIKNILTPHSLIFFLFLTNLNSQQRKLEYHVKSVSYTHLPLPTNREV